MHFRFLRRGVIAAAAIIALGACNKGQTPSSSSASDTGNTASALSRSTDSSDSDGNDAITHIACDKIFKPSDVAGVLSGNVTVSVYPYRSNACEFSSDSGPTVTLYSGNGDTEQLEWREANANAQGRYTPLAGFGDQAFYRNSGSSETQVRKGDYYCAISGGKPGDEADAKRLAGLCNKIFAAR